MVVCMKNKIIVDGKEYVISYTIISEEYYNIKEVLGISLHLDPQSIIINKIVDHDTGKIIFPAAKPDKYIISHIPGVVVKITVKPGDSVKKGQVVAIVESMKMENDITSEYNGIVKKVLVPEKIVIERKEPILELE